MFVDDIVMVCMSFVLLLIFTYVTFKVTRIIKCGDKILLWMLIFLILTLISKNYCKANHGCLCIAKIGYFIMDIFI